MELVNYFYKRNKSLIVLIITLLTLWGSSLILLCNKVISYGIAGATLSSKINLLKLLNFGILILIYAMIVFLFINNIRGSKRKIIIKYYGKDKFLKYLLSLNILIVVVGYLIFITYILSVFHASYLYENPISNNLELYKTMQSIYFKSQSLTYITIIAMLNIVFYVFLSIKDLFVSTRYKYQKRTKRMIQAIGKIILNLAIGFFLLEIITIMAINSGFKSYLASVYFTRVEISFQIYLLLLVLVLILIILDYIKYYKEEVFL